MTEDSVKETVVSEEVNDPLAELKKMIGEQNAVILKQNEMIKSLTARMNESEKTSVASPVVSEPKVPEKSPQDIAWESMMKEMNMQVLN